MLDFPAPVGPLMMLISPLLNSMLSRRRKLRIIGSGSPYSRSQANVALFLKPMKLASSSLAAELAIAVTEEAEVDEEAEDGRTVDGDGSNASRSSLCNQREVNRGLLNVGESVAYVVEKAVEPVK